MSLPSSEMFPSRASLVSLLIPTGNQLCAYSLEIGDSNAFFSILLLSCSHMYSLTKDFLVF